MKLIQPYSSKNNPSIFAVYTVIVVNVGGVLYYSSTGIVVEHG